MLSVLCLLSVAQVSVSGIAGDGRGLYVPEAVVTARHQTRSVSSVTVKAGPSGDYRLTLTDPGVYLIEAQAEGYLPPPHTRDFQARIIRVLKEEKRDVRLDLRLVRPGSIRGRLLLRPEEGPEGGTDAQAAAGVSVGLFEVRYVRGQRTPVPVPEVAPVLSSADGGFVFPSVPPGDYVLDVLPARADLIRPAAEPSKPASGVYRTQWPDVSAPLSLYAGGELDTGSVLLDHGPLQRVLANLEFDPCEGNLFVTWGQRLGKLNLQHARQMVPCGGPVAIDNVSPGDYILAASFQGASVAGYRYIHLPVHVTAREPVNIRQQAANLAFLRGRIHLPDGATAGWTNVQVQMFPVSGSPSLVEAAPVSVDPSGQFQVPVRAGWTYSLTVHGLPAKLALSHIAHNGVRLQSRIVALGDAAAHDTLAIHLSDRLADVAGIVTGADGKPAERATVLLAHWPAVLSDGFPVTMRTESLEDGSFTLAQVPAGRYRAVAIHDPAAVDDDSAGSLLSRFAAGDQLEVRDGQAVRIRLTVR